MPVTQPTPADGFEPLTPHQKQAKTTTQDGFISTPAPESLVIHDNTSASLINQTGAKKATIDLSSTTTGLISSIDSSANPMDLAQSISEILVKSSKPGKPIAPFTSAEVANLAGYIKQMNEGTISSTLYDRAGKALLTKLGVPELSPAQLKEIASDSFNSYLDQLLVARSTELSPAQLGDAIISAEAPKSMLQRGIDAVRNPIRMALSSTPVLETSTISSPITLPTAIRTLPEGVKGASSLGLEGFTTFKTSLESTLKSMQPAAAKELVAKLLGNIDTSLPDSLMNRAFNGDGLTIDRQSTNLMFFDTQLSETAHFDHLFPETVSTINKFLEKISSDQHHPIQITNEATFQQAKASLIPMLREVFKPILDKPLEGKTRGSIAEPASSVSLAQGIHDRVMNSQLGSYAGKIDGILNKKLGTDPTLLAKASEAITVQFEYLKESFIKNGYPTKDAAITAMDTLLAASDGTFGSLDSDGTYISPDPDAKKQLISEIEKLHAFLTASDPILNAENQILINDLLKNMKSDLTITPTNVKAIATALSPLKVILESALPAAEPLFTKAKIVKSPEAATSQFIEGVLGQKAGRTRMADSLPKSQKDAIRLQDTAQIIATAIQATKGNSPYLKKIQTGDNAAATINHLVTDASVGTYVLSNPVAKQSLVSDIAALKAFLETPTFVKDSKTSEIINNLLSNVKSDLRLSSENYMDISGSLASLKPVLDFALEGLKGQFFAPLKPEAAPAPTSPAPRLESPAALIKPAEALSPANPTATVRPTIEAASPLSSAGTSDPGSAFSPAQSLPAIKPAATVLRPEIRPTIVQETALLAQTSKAITAKNTSPDKALTTMNDLLTTSDERYNLSDPLAKKALIDHMKGLSEIINHPELIMQGDNEIYINTLLENMGSSLTITPTNATKVALALSPLKDLIQVATQPKPAPATSTWASSLTSYLPGWN